MMRCLSFSYQIGKDPVSYRIFPSVRNATNLLECPPLVLVQSLEKKKRFSSPAKILEDDDPAKEKKQYQ